MARMINGQALPKPPPAGNFIRGAYSFRRGVSVSGQQRPHWTVFRKGERSHWAIVHSITESTDGSCYIVSGSGHAYDARTTFDEAVALVLARLAMGK